MKSFFLESTYKTSDVGAQQFFVRRARHTHLYFYAKILSTAVKYRKKISRGTFNSESWINASHEVLKIIESYGGRFFLSGLENLRNNRKPVVIISNHMSTLETMILPCIVAPVMDVTFVVKQKLVENPVLGSVLSRQNPILVGRDNSREDFKTVMNEGMEKLAVGTSIIIFPQSTRRVEFRPEEFNSIGVKLASKAGVQVIPLAVKTDLWRNGRVIKELGHLHRKKTIHMRFGKPLQIKGTGKEENKKVIEFISLNLAEWGNKG